MGYDLHITRADYHWTNEGRKIEASEWHALIESDPELRLDNDNKPHFAIWTAHPENGEAWLDWREGNIETKNPDEPLVLKMIEIAQKLHAKVQGDDGEEYTEATLAAPPPKASLFSNLPLLSMILSLIGFVGLAIAIPFDSYIRRQYPPGGGMPTHWAWVLTAAVIPAVLGLVIGTVFALLSFYVRQKWLHFAWIALVVNAVTFGVILVMK
jgi:uncharacterized protein (DUF736 family)